MVWMDGMTPHLASTTMEPGSVDNVGSVSTYSERSIFWKVPEAREPEPVIVAILE